MDLSPFRLDIDELINEFAECGFTSFGDMKKVWIGRKFTYIFEAAPSTNLAFFMQSIFAQSISHMRSAASLPHRLGGLYCLYCLYETQPFRPPYKIYLSIGELKKLKELVIDAKENNVKVVSFVVKRMLEKNMFLFGSVDMNESAALETVNQLTELQNARVQVAYNKLFNDTPIENYIHMDLGMEVGSNLLTKMSTDYSEAKKLALYASKIVDVQDIKHIAEDEKLIGDTVEKIAEDWNVQRGVFYEQTGLDQQLIPVEADQQLLEDHTDVDFDKELERMLTDV
ncbi:hypothetical protein IC582_011858 [Cucumis melo]|uniref:Small nuclear RNA activating complex (SNAPc), subunit SNAP43 n=1 Tax=Cucumis melo TaxID=3656 RepID=A0A9I9CJC4_CUCME